MRSKHRSKVRIWRENSVHDIHLEFGRYYIPMIYTILINKPSNDELKILLTTSGRSYCHELNFPFKFWPYSDVYSAFSHANFAPYSLWPYSNLTPMLLRIFPHQPRSILLRRSDVFLFSDSLVFRELLLHWLTVIAAATLCHNIYPPLLFIFCTRPCSHSYLVALTTSP